MKKKITAFALLLVASIFPAYAVDSGAIDGLYQCNVNLDGLTTTSFMSVNGKYDGRTVFLIAAENELSNGFSGFGLGRVSGNRFSGNTSYGKRFMLDLELIGLDAEGYYSGVNLKGRVGVISSKGHATNAVIDCKTIW